MSELEKAHQQYYERVGNSTFAELAGDLQAMSFSLAVIAKRLREIELKEQEKE